MTAPNLLDELEGVVLLPCPFCGGEAEITEQEDEDGRFAAVICPMCGAGSRQHYFVGDDARPHVVGAWNKRTHHATLADMAKRLEAAERDAKRYAFLRDHNNVIGEDGITECPVEIFIHEGEG